MWPGSAPPRWPGGELADEQIRDLLHAEIDERLSAAEEFTAGGHAERATMLRAEAAVLTELLGDV